MPTTSFRQSLRGHPRAKTVWLVASGDCASRRNSRLADAGEAGTVLTPLWPTSVVTPAMFTTRSKVMGSSIASVWECPFSRYTSRCTLGGGRTVWQYSTCPGRSPLHRGPVLTSPISTARAGLGGTTQPDASMTRWEGNTRHLEQDFTDEWFVTDKAVDERQDRSRRVQCARAYLPDSSPEFSLALPSQQALTKASWAYSTRGAWACTTP